jgi:hypothetical protein
VGAVIAVGDSDYPARLWFTTDDLVGYFGCGNVENQKAEGIIAFD